MHTSVDSTAGFIEAVYRKMESSLALVRKRLGRPLTYAEKVLYGHLEAPSDEQLEAGVSYIKTRPDRVALQDATAQMAILQFMLAGKDQAAVPVTVHCDHLIRAHKGANPDLVVAGEENREVYDFLASASAALRIRLLAAGRRHHPSGRARTLCLPRPDDARHRFPHPQCRWARLFCRRRRRRRRGRRDGRSALGGPASPHRRRTSQGQAAGLDRPERHHPPPSRPTDLLRRHQPGL